MAEEMALFIPEDFQLNTTILNYHQHNNGKFQVGTFETRKDIQNTILFQSQLCWPNFWQFVLTLHVIKKEIERNNRQV